MRQGFFRSLSRSLCSFSSSIIQSRFEMNHWLLWQQIARDFQAFIIHIEYNLGTIPDFSRNFCFMWDDSQNTNWCKSYYMYLVKTDKPNFDSFPPKKVQNIFPNLTFSIKFLSILHPIFAIAHNYVIDHMELWKRSMILKFVIWCNIILLSWWRCKLYF